MQKNLPKHYLHNTLLPYLCGVFKHYNHFNLIKVLIFMKRIFAVLTVSVIMFFSACSSGPDQTLLGSISTFENSWSSLVSETGSLGSSLKTEVAKMQGSPELQAIMSAKVDAKKKNSLDSTLTAMRDISGKSQSMSQAVDATSAKLNEMTTAFTAWKEKVTKGEIKADAAKTQLADYEKQMGEVKNQLSSMQQEWSNLNGQYGTLMAAATALVSSTAAVAPATTTATGKQGMTGSKPAPAKTTTTTTTTKPTGGTSSTTTTTTTTTTPATPAAKAVEQIKEQRKRGNATTVPVKPN